MAKQVKVIEVEAIEVTAEEIEANEAVVETALAPAAETAVAVTAEAKAEVAVAQAQAQVGVLRERLFETEENGDRLRLIEAAEAMMAMLAQAAAGVVNDGKIDNGAKARLLEALAEARSAMAEFELEAEVEVVKTPKGTPMKAVQPGFRQVVQRIRKSYEELSVVVASAADIEASKVTPEDIAELVRLRMRSEGFASSRARADILREWNDEAKARVKARAAEAAKAERMNDALLAAARQVLRNANGPLDYRAITARVREHLQWQPVGYRVKEAIRRDIRNKGAASQFRQIDPDTFASNPAEQHSGEQAQALSPENSERREYLRALARLLPEQTQVDSPENSELHIDTLPEQTQALSPEDFERLISTLLERMGFDNVTQTPLSGDGGIDVRGDLVVAGVVRIRMAVQAKRWTGNVGSPVVQQLRGSLGVHEQGLIITTSDFTAGAKEEAERPDASPVALMNGDQLARLLTRHEVGAADYAGAVGRDRHGLLSRDTYAGVPHCKACGEPHDRKGRALCATCDANHPWEGTA